MSTFRTVDERRVVAVTKEQWAERITHVPNSPARGTRIVPGETKPRPVDDWRDQALCRGQTTGPDSVWVKPTYPRRREVAKAAALCAVCPVIDQCRALPLPHVGIMAGVIYWHGPRRGAGSGECRQCGGPVRSPLLYCSNQCKGRWHYENTQPARWPAAPLLAYLEGWPMRRICDELGVSRKLVWRWRNTGEVAPTTGRMVCRRLRVDPSTFWPGVV